MLNLLLQDAKKQIGINMREAQQIFSFSDNVPILTDVHVDEIEKSFNELWKMPVNNKGVTVAGWRGKGQNKREGLKAYRARRKENHTHEQIVDGCLGYAKFKWSDIGGKYTMSLSRFLGKSRHFLDFLDMKDEDLRAQSTKGLDLQDQLTNTDWAFNYAK